MKLDLTVTITTAIALVSLISPIFVSVINNRHQRKIRKMELEYDMDTRKLSSLYEDKKVAFTNFLIAAGKMCTDETSHDTEMDFYAYTQTSILFASKENQKLISDFSSEILRYINIGIPPEMYNVLKVQLSTIASSLNSELSTLQTEIYNRPNRI